MIEFLMYFSAGVLVTLMAAIGTIAFIKPRRRRALERRHHRSKREQVRSNN